MRLLLAVLMLALGYGITGNGYRTLVLWPSISVMFAACGFLWAVAGAAMLGAGAWVIGTLGRSLTPLWIAGIAAVLSGGSLVAGVLTNVVPCTGPD